MYLEKDLLDGEDITGIWSDAGTYRFQVVSWRIESTYFDIYKEGIFA